MKLLRIMFISPRCALVYEWRYSFIVSEGGASALERLGFTCHRQRGSHKIYVKDDHQVTVPIQTKDLKKGTLHQIVKGNKRKIVFITKQ